MTARTAAGRAGGAPIAVQVGMLLIVSLIAAQAFSLMLVLLTPPPPVPLYQLSEVARALQGGALDARFGPPLLRATADQPPAEPSGRSFPDAAARTMLSSMLGATPERLKFVWAGHPMIAFHRGRSRPPASLFDMPPDPPPPHAMRMMSPEGMGSPEGMHLAGGGVVGAFVAALQRPDGRWTVVRTPPEPFIRIWHQRMAMWLFGCLLIVLPAAYLFARRITAPIDGFARAAQALGRDPNAPPMAVSGPAEIGAAASAFNDMQARIRRYVEDRTAMVGAVSHDLRTPLARIRYKMESAPDGLKGQVLSDVDQMERMIGSVLAFIREGRETGARERLDLLSIVECVVDDAGLAGADVEIVDGSPLAVTGDGLALQRMLANLVDNAVKYGGRARIEVEAAGDDAVIRIADNGPGLPAAELEQVFKPFYRPGKARTLDDGGVGLGLSVARSIARSHGGDVQLEPSAGGGLTAVVRLPLA